MKLSTRIAVLMALLALSLPVFGQDDRLQIVASHSILGDVVSNVVGDSADITVTMPVGADPHGFEPVPSDLTALADADVVFINGAFFEEGLLEAIENAGAEMNIIEASSCVEIIPIGAGGHDHDDDHEEGDDHDHEEGEDDHEEGDDHDHEEGEDHNEEAEAGESVAMADTSDMGAMIALCDAHRVEFEGYHEDEDHNEEMEEMAEGEEEGDHDHAEVETLGRLFELECGEGHGHEGEDEDHNEEEGEEEDHDHAHGEGACDPHVWMEPHNVMYWTMLVRDTLIEMDPANAETYTANAQAYLETLDELMHDFVMPLVDTLPEENRILVTSHDSLGYLAARFEFELVGTIIPGGSTLAESSVQDVAELIDLINEEGVPAVFGETTVNDSVAQTVADETGASLQILYSGTLSDSDGPAATYVDYIRYNYTTIVEALGDDM